METQRQFGNTKQTAERYGLSESKLNKDRIYGGGAPFLKVGRKILYDWRIFEAWLSKHQRGSTSDAGGAL
ncbi:MAG: DNA-binding protein [Holosporales bacterium]|jgi:hypothetical protein